MNPTDTMIVHAGVTYARAEAKRDREGDLLGVIYRHAATAATLFVAND